MCVVVTAVLVLTGGLSETESLSDEDVSVLGEKAKVLKGAVAMDVEEDSIEDFLVPLVEVSEVGVAF